MNKEYKMIRKQNNKMNLTVRKDHIRCGSCGEDSGWSHVLHMVIPADGLHCHNCGAIVIYGPRIEWDTSPKIGEDYDWWTSNKVRWQGTDGFGIAPEWCK